MSRLDDYRIGDRVTLQLWRDGNLVRTQVVLQGGS